MKKRLLVCLLGLIFYSNSYSQLTSDFYNPSVIRHKLQDLNVVGSVLYIAAHPDDENTRLISYLTKERHLRTGYLSLTRGDGGQNLIGTEQGTDLGVLRSEELLAARRIDGAEQFFSTATDFGYSKNPEETFEKWDREKVLKDVVTIIRLFRPDVIICRFPTTGEGGHGHHTASAILAEMAFDIAADPNYKDHNNQPAWHTTRLLWNTFNFGTTNTTAEDQLKIDVGGYNALLGKSYGEISAESRSQHRSQGFGSARTRGEQFEYFKHIKGIQAKSDLMDFVNLNWNKFDALKDQQQSIQQHIKEADLLLKDGKNKEFVQKMISLRRILSRGAGSMDPGENDNLRYLQDDQWLFRLGSAATDIKYRIRKIDELILAASGVYVDILAQKQFYYHREQIRLDVNLINRGNLSCFYRCTHVHNFEDCTVTDSTALQFNKPFKKTVSISDPQTSFFKDRNKMPLYKSTIILRIEGEEISINLPVLYKKVDPSYGELFYPVSVVPGLVVTKMPEPIVRAGNESISLRIKSHVAVKNAHVKTYASMTGANQADSIGEMAAGEERVIRIDLNSFWKNSEHENQNFAFLLSSRDSTGKWQTDGAAMNNFSYTHISEWNVFYPSNIEIARLNVNPKVKTIAYINGAGDKVAESLRQLGYQVDELSDEQIAGADLSQYPVIITGIRAHNTREILQAQHPRLMQYIKNGGRLIVQYNTNSRVGPLNTKIGPYPFTISRDRVTDENAEVKILDSKSVFVNKPYKLDSNDFAGWIQERSIYQVSDRDSNYKALFRMHDPGEKESDGSLIYAKYGKGSFIYTGIVFFRELPAGVPGAYKLFINLIEAKY